MNAPASEPSPLTQRGPTSSPRSGLYAQPGVGQLDRFLAHMLKLDASDLYLTVGCPPVFRACGEGLKGKTSLSGREIEMMIDHILTEAQKIDFAATHELNFVVERGEGRFRINVFRQRGESGMVVRLVRTTIKTLDDLGYPATMKDIAMSRRGLVLVVGGTGSGKSTALAAMIDHRNASETGHIVTIEDPIEFVHQHKAAVITQREVGVDTLSVEAALKSALRQAPDVILIGEIRDARAMEAALGFAETGHLCISTLHANNADQAIERVLNFFSSERHPEVRSQLAVNLRAIVSQRLIPTLAGGRAAALEILLDTPRVKQLIKRGETEALKDAMEQSAPEGCRTFDQSLFELFASGQADAEDVLKVADSPNNVRIRIERSLRGEALTREGEPVLRLLPER